MDQRIFDQLDVLTRGARLETRPAHNEYHNSSADFSAYEGHDTNYGPLERVQHAYEQEYDAFPDQPMVLDSFGIIT